MYGTGIFNVEEREYILIAADGNVYACLENNFPLLVPLPTGVTITATVRFTQAGATIYMWRGVDLEPLKCSDLTTGFTTVDDPPSGSGAQRIPNGIRAVIVSNRMWVQAADDSVWPSDELDFESYDLALVQRIHSNPGDFLQTIIPFGRGVQSTIVALKRRSVKMLVNTAGDLTDLVQVTVTARFGCVAADSVADWGSDLAWLSDEGVASLVLTEQGEVQPSVRSGREPQEMLSDEIQPLIERINWKYASNAKGAFWNGHYYLAVPLDDAETFREELIQNQVNYRGGVPPHTFTIPNRLVVGARYRYVRSDSNTTSVSDGTTTLTADGDFVAASTTLTGSSNASTTCTDSLKRVFRGVNTAILVYSTRNAAWAGYDTTPGLEVRHLFLGQQQSRLHLFFASEDGWINMYEYAFEDAVAVPYADLSIDTQPSVGNTVQINLSPVITVITGATNTATQWARSTSVTTARRQFYILTTGLGASSYNQQDVDPWGAMDTTPTVLTTVDAGTFRFYSTNGIPPVITIAGSWGTITVVTKQPVPFSIKTRAYKMTDEVMSGRVLNLALQLQTWNPEVTIATIPEGVEEEQEIVSDETRSRTRYFRPFTRADWVQTNANDDFLTPFREDYSLVFTSQTMSLTIGSGIKLDQHQEFPRRVPGQGRGRTMQVSLSNTEGRTRLLAAQTDGIGISRGAGLQI